MILFFDTETTGLPEKHADPIKNPELWPRLVELAWVCAGDDQKILDEESFLIQPDGFSIPADATDIHGISTEMAYEKGYPLAYVLDQFLSAVRSADLIVAHNLYFDKGIISAELTRIERYEDIINGNGLCTMLASTKFCNFADRYGRRRWPSLSGLYQVLFSREMNQNHRALDDVKACSSCYFELKARKVID